jgi:hypothetical protein
MITFSGEFKLNKKLTVSLSQFINALSNTVRCVRKVDNYTYGFESEFFVNDNFSDISKPIRVPSTQPMGLLEWKPNNKRNAIIWTGNANFNTYAEWLLYLIEKILAPNGYILYGEVIYNKDNENGKLIVIKNKIFNLPQFGDSIEVIPTLNLRLDFPYIDIKPIKKYIKKSWTKKEVITLLLLLGENYGATKDEMDEWLEFNI